MQRYAPVVGFSVLFLGFVLFVSLAHTSPEPVVAPVAESRETSTVAVVPTLSVPTIAPSDVPTETKSAPAPDSKPVVAPTKKVLTTTQTPAPKQPTPTAPPPQPLVEAESSDTALGTAAIALRRALVNIICYAPAGGAIKSISGSGVFVDSKGIILTNAHIAQYFLLENHHISCVVRSGSPATDRYTASLMYISPDWVEHNQALLTEPNPSGTGQYDFALLAVTGSANGAALPASYPSVPLATGAPAVGAPVVLASYAAQSLSFNDILTALFPTIVFSSVKDVYTFAVDSVDVLELGGSAAAQEGSSGGGVVNDKGSLVATLTTSVVSGAQSERTMHAITASYIRFEYARETGTSLDSLLAQPPAAAVASFSSRTPALEAAITSHLQ